MGLAADASLSYLMSRQCSIYGGGAVTGIFMAQLARLSGLRTVAVASPPNFEYLQSEAVGVTACVDRYATPEEIAQQVREITQKDGSGGVRYILDCVGSTTATLCRDVAVSTLEKEKGKDNAGAAEMVCLAGNPKPSVRSEDKALQDPITVHRISFSTTIYGDELFARSVMDDLGELLDTDQLQPVRPEFVSDGLAGVRYVMGRRIHRKGVRRTILTRSSPLNQARPRKTPGQQGSPRQKAGCAHSRHTTRTPHQSRRASRNMLERRRIAKIKLSG